MQHSTRNLTSRRACFHLFLLLMVAFSLLPSLDGGTPARADDSVAVTATPASDPDVATTGDIDNDHDGSDPSLVADWSGGQPPATDVPDPNPTETAIAATEDSPASPNEFSANPPSAIASIETPEPTPTTEAPVIETSTSNPTPTTTPPTTPTSEVGALALGDTGVRVTIKDGVTDGNPIAGVCMTLMETNLGIWQDSGCTDANGQLELNPIFTFSDPTLFELELVIPPGYSGEDFHFVTLIPGTVIETFYVLGVADPADDTMRAFDLDDNTALGGACWSYYTTTTILDQPGDLAFGPICDDDSDGTTLIPQVAFGAYCIVVTPPTGFRVAGDDTFCTSAQRNRDVTKGFISGSGGSASVVVTITTTLGLPQPNVCVAAVLELVALLEYIELSSACSGVDGVATITGLVPGNYILYVNNHPAYVIPFDRIDITVPDATPFQVDATVDQITGDSTLDAVIGWGPTTLAGACWSLTPNDNGVPGPVTIIGPLCDDDGDGRVTMEGVPFGSFCYTVLPPSGWHRPLADYSFCRADIGYASWRVGFIPVPGTPRPTNTPFPTQTPFPTPVPAENEPNGNVVVQNCSYTGIDFDFRMFDLCVPVGSGVRLGVIQNGVQVEVLVTNASGLVTLALPARSTYRLRYLDGNSSGFVPGPGQEERNRYGAADSFSFTPAGGIPDWTMTVRTTSRSYWNNGALIGGACYRIVDDQGNERLPAACDTDNDGITVVGSLPAEVGFGGLNPYRAEMTSPPPGYDLSPGSRIGLPQPGNPPVWTAGFTYTPVQLRIHTVDENGDPLPGWCYVSSTFLFSSCDAVDGDDGTTTMTSFAVGDQVVITAEGYSEGYFPDTPSKLITIGSGPTQDVTFTAYRYGTDRADRADVRFTLRTNTGTILNESDDICFSISPASGVPAGELCADSNGVLIYRNLPVGSYSLKLERNTFASGCGSPSTFPQIPFSVSAGDLGTVIEIPVVFTCPPPPPSSNCQVVRYPITRSVDIYLGTLTDPDSEDVLVEGLQFSESIPFLMTQDLLLSAVNPDPERITRDSIEPWVLDASDSTVWGDQPDWDGNARQGLLDQFADSGPIIAGEPELIATREIVASIGIEFIILSVNDPRRADYPECSASAQTVEVLLLHQGTINVYELNATLARDDQPEPTPTQTPKPFCSTTVTRSLSAAYGELTGPDGERIFTGLELSDHIPAGLIEAIQRSGAPGNVEDLLGEWFDPQASDETWGSDSSEALDAEGNLVASYQEVDEDVNIGTATDGGAEEYRFSTYRWVDQSELPAGCFTAASFGLLVPVEQETIVRLAFTELNATLGGSIDPSPTPTGTSTPTPTGTAGPTVSPTSTAVSVTTLPNTGAQERNSSSDGRWVIVLIITAFIAIGGYLRYHRERRSSL